MTELFPLVIANGQILDRRETCAWLAARLRSGEEISPGQREFLAHALEVASTGGDIASALGTKKRRGGQRKNIDRDYWIYQRIDGLCFEGKKLVEAYEIVGAECAKWGQFPNGDPAEAVKEIYLAWRKYHRDAQQVE